MIKNTDRIKSSAIIAEVIGDYVRLSKRGSHLLGLCPFHNEKTGSFTVSPSRNSFKCFGCGESGDSVSFLMKHEAMNYPESLRYIAKKYSVDVEEDELSDKEKVKLTKKDSLKIVTAFAQKVFVHNFKASKGYDYMSSVRNFKASTLTDFGIGFAKDSWEFLSNSAMKRGYKPEYLISSGLSGNKKTGGIYDRFRNRVMFPYFDLSGNIIGFTSRILSDSKKEAKYINSTNSELFDKSSVLYGLFQAKKAIVKLDTCYLVEGNTDVMAFHQLGVANTVGTSGTALSETQVKLIKRFTSNVLLMFDSDNAGGRAALMSINKFIAHGFKVEVVILPEGEDPFSFSQGKLKADVLAFVNKNKVDFIHYQAGKLLKGKSSAKDIAKSVKVITDTLLLIEDEQERRIQGNQLSEKFNLDSDFLKKQLFEKKTEKSSDDDFFALEKATVKESDKINLLKSRQYVIDRHLKGEFNYSGYTEFISIGKWNNLKSITKNISFVDLYVIDDLVAQGKETEFCLLCKRLIVNGFNIDIVIDNESPVGFDEDNTRISFVDFYITSLAKRVDYADDNSKKAAFEKSAEIISFLSETERMLKVKSIVSTFKDCGYEISVGDFKKILTSYLKDNQKHSAKEVTISSLNPHGLTKEELESLDKYSFYEKDNQLYFEDQRGAVALFSNYKIEPLFHIRSTNETRKLFKITNNRNQEEIIEVDIESMVRLDKWLIFCEEKGNFLFWGNKGHFVRLKQKLYDDTKFCYSIENLGWQKAGFWAWADGVVYNNQFLPTDNYGIVKVGEKNYYSPAFSDLYRDDRSVFKVERKFKRKHMKITFNDWAEKFTTVYGENARLSACALMTTVFSDFIFSVVGSIPLINLFGVKGTGKTEHAKSLLNFFGDEQNLLNIHKGTEYAAAVHLENFKNAFALIDEYKNNLDIRKIEYLKSIYNRDGRLRGSIKAGVKTETTQVNSMVLLCGQEMPTADVALFSRLVFLPYYKPKFSQKQKNQYNELKSIEKEGLTHLIEELLKYREVIEKNYEKEFYKIEKQFSEKMDSDIDGRLIKNYTTIITTFKVLENYIELPFTYEELFKLSCNRIREQFSIMSTSNEVSAFWESLVSLIERGAVRYGENYRIESEISREFLVKVDGSFVKQNFDFSGMKGNCKDILYLKMSTIYDYYAELAAKTRQEIMPKKSLEYYLEHSESFIGKRKSFRFGANSVTTAWAFDYDKVGIDIKVISDDSSTDIDEQAEEEKIPF